MKPYTADTITDDQIRGLAREALTAAQHRDCAVALRARRETLTSIPAKLATHYPTTKQRRAARARCARLLNERLGLVPRCAIAQRRAARASLATPL